MKLFLLKLKVSLAAVGRILARPAYGLLASAISVIVLWVLLWFFNLNLLLFVFGQANLSGLEKAAFLFNSLESILTNFDPLTGGVLLLFAILSGVNLATLVFLLRHSRQQTRLTGSSRNATGALAALIGSACAACGGSILAPLFAAFGASLSLTAVHRIGALANLVGIILVSYSIYGLGKQAAGAQAKARLAG